MLIEYVLFLSNKQFDYIEHIGGVGDKMLVPPRIDGAQQFKSPRRDHHVKARPS